MVDTQNSTKALAYLLQQAEQLSAQLDGGRDLPRVERNLDQLVAAAERHFSRERAVRDEDRVRAAQLLATKGLELPVVTPRLKSLLERSPFEPLEPLEDTDVQGYLENIHQNLMVNAVETVRKQTQADFEDRMRQLLRTEADQTRQKLMAAMDAQGGLSDTTVTAGDASAIFSSADSSRSFVSGLGRLSALEAAYCKQVHVYNDRVLEGGVRPDMVHLFRDAVSDLDRTGADIWDLMACVTELPLTGGGRSSPDIQTALIRRSRRYLENKFLLHLRTVVEGNLHVARMGSRAGTLSLVKAYLNVRPVDRAALEPLSVDGHPFWAVLFYILHCGDVDAALDLCRDPGHQQTVGELVDLMEAYGSNRRLSDTLAQRVSLLYQHSVKHSTDPFRRAVYCVIGRFGFGEDHSVITTDVESYLWLKLGLVRPAGGERGGSNVAPLVHQDDVTTLTEFQRLLLEEYGESHFQVWERPFPYVQVLLLTGQFEAAVEFLFRIDRYRPHALHIALTLHELGLLFTTHDGRGELLTRYPSDPVPMRRLNFARMVGNYVNQFATTNPQNAVDYLYFLRGVSSSEADGQPSLFVTYLAQLACDTQEFQLLFGSLELDGMKRAGIVDRYVEADTIGQVARLLDARGMYREAAHLYDLAGQHEQALSLLNKILCQIAMELGTTLTKRGGVVLAASERIAERYRRHGCTATHHTLATFQLLLDLCTFFDCYNRQQPGEALRIMQDLRFLPFSDEAIAEKTEALDTYTDEVRRLLPLVLVRTMELIGVLHGQVKAELTGQGSRSLVGASEHPPDAHRQQSLVDLRRAAKSLSNFAASQPFRLPGDAMAEIVRLETMIT